MLLAVSLSNIPFVFAKNTTGPTSSRRHVAAVFDQHVFPFFIRIGIVWHIPITEILGVEPGHTADMGFASDVSAIAGALELALVFACNTAYIVSTIRIHISRIASICDDPICRIPSSNPAEILCICAICLQYQIRMDIGNRTFIFPGNAAYKFMASNRSFVGKPIGFRIDGRAILVESGDTAYILIAFDRSGRTIFQVSQCRPLLVHAN